MKKIKKIIFAVLYIAFSFLYAMNVRLVIKNGPHVAVDPFNLETFVMMMFCGVYIVVFWIAINKLFRH